MDREVELEALAAALAAAEAGRGGVVLLEGAAGTGKTAEVADFLATSVAAVNSALQRAHATLGSEELARLEPGDDESRRGLVGRYVTAFEADDVDALAALSRCDRSRAAFAS